MKTTIKLTTLALSGLLVATPVLFSPAFAEGVKTPASSTADTGTPEATPLQAQESADKINQSIVKTANDALAAMQSVHAARQAIFNGQTDEAVKLTTEAQASLTKALAESASYAMMVPKAKEGGDVYLPIDSNIALVEGFSPTDAQKPVLNDASKLMAKGAQKDAVAQLKLAEVDLSVSVAMIPSKESAAQIDDAVMLLKGGKYYEASQALKAAEDLVVVENYNIDELPTQGTATN